MYSSPFLLSLIECDINARRPLSAPTSISLPVAHCCSPLPSAQACPERVRRAKEIIGKTKETAYPSSVEAMKEGLQSFLNLSPRLLGLQPPFFCPLLLLPELHSDASLWPSSSTGLCSGLVSPHPWWRSSPGPPAAPLVRSGPGSWAGPCPPGLPSHLRPQDLLLGLLVRAVLEVVWILYGHHRHLTVGWFFAPFRSGQ